LIAFGPVFNDASDARAADDGAGVAEVAVPDVPAVALPLVPAAAATPGALDDDAPDPESTIGEAARSGVVTTPPAPGTAASCATAGASPGAVSRSTCPTRMTLTFSMLFHAASSR